MKQLHDTIPDVDVLLGLEPEELGAKLLFLLRRHKSGMFTLNGLVHELHEINRFDETRGYPRARASDVEIALTEAFLWLEYQVLLIPADESNGRNGYRILSRRAERFADEAGFRSYVAARRLPRELLHVSIAGEVWVTFARGDYSTAVFQALRAVEIAVRDAAGCEPRDIGVPLMRKAFGKTGPLRDAAGDVAEADALEHLFAGAIGAYKNSHSHRNVPMDDAEEAIEIVMLASHLLRIVDARRPERAP